MTDTALSPALYEWEHTVNQLDLALKRLGEAVGPGSGPLHDCAWSAADLCTRQLAQLLGDRLGWIEWYRYENDMGRCARKAKAATWARERRIRTLHDLAQLIEASTV
ncbi:hypothetical protein [Pseudoxanthomonas sp. USHLN014]|uniref:hypothetical protein n=1 Tax=Pseudoxanthomonas sp. USHLN014 TaxID=3081297 RepID=UPI00301B7D19